MPRYFFDLQSDRDDCGCDLPDLAAARQLAQRYAGEILRDADRDDTRDYWRLDVRQHGRGVLFSLVVELLAAPRVAILPPAGQRRAAPRTGEEYV